jgi:hypothetical protein
LHCIAHQDTSSKTLSYLPKVIPLARWLAKGCSWFLFFLQFCLLSISSPFVISILNFFVSPAISHHIWSQSDAFSLIWFFSTVSSTWSVLQFHLLLPVHNTENKMIFWNHKSDHANFLHNSWQWLPLHLESNLNPLS